MEAIKRYWRALGEAPRAAIFKCLRFELVLSVVVTIICVIATCIAFDALEREDILGAFQVLGFLVLLLIVSLICVIYGYVLVYRAYRAVKQWLFSLNASGYPTEATWTAKDTWLLAVALVGFTGLLPNLIGVITEIALGEWSASLPGMVVWVVIGIVTTPIAARRYIPLL